MWHDILWHVIGECIDRVSDSVKEFECWGRFLTLCPTHC
jgi:hypothetical protein